MRKKISCGRFFLSIAVVMALAGNFKCPVMAAGNELPKVTADTITWEGGVLEIPVDLGSYAADEVYMYVGIPGATTYYYSVELTDTQGTVSLVENDEHYDSLKSTTAFSSAEAGERSIDVEFVDSNWEELCHDSFDLIIPEDSEKWYFPDTTMKFDGSQDVTFNFERGTNYFELQSIDDFSLFMVSDLGMGPSETLDYGFVVDMEKGQITFDKDVLGELINSSVGSVESLQNNVVQISMNATAVKNEKVQILSSERGYDPNGYFPWKLDLSEFVLDGEEDVTTPSTVFTGINTSEATISSKAEKVIESSALSFIQNNYSGQLGELKDGYTIESEMIINKIDDSAVPLDIRDAFETAAGNRRIAQYYDISIRADVVVNDKVVEGLNDIYITKLSEPVLINLHMPKDLVKGDGLYSMFRYHAGGVDLLSTSEEDNMIIFNTDLFSIYALAYDDVGDSIENTQNTMGESDNMTTEQLSQIAQTGDETQVFSGVALLMGSVFVTAISCFVRRKGII